MIVYTSGTTGYAKGVMLSFRDQPFEKTTTLKIKRKTG
jgi:long-subunit acyl-CoA synthetase (AMP-forming)